MRLKIYKKRVLYVFDTYNFKILHIITE